MKSEAELQRPLKELSSGKRPLGAPVPSAVSGDDTHHEPGSWGAFMQTHKVPLILFYYGACSSTLIVINKVAVHTLQAPVTILVLQLLFAALCVKGLNFAGVLEAEGLQWRLVRPFLLIVAGFLGTLYGACASHHSTART
jgi:hypothetical protein